MIFSYFTIFLTGSTLTLAFSLGVEIYFFALVVVTGAFTATFFSVLGATAFF
jgi:hypothetical protein